MAEVLEVQCTDIQDELMRLQFANCQLVSDHPREFGGTDTGPAPGEIVIMALTSATALAGRQFAQRKKLNVGHIGARASMTTVKEGFAEELGPVPLPQLTFIERFWRLIEVESALGESERDALVQAMGDNRIAKTIRAGFELNESVVFHRPATGRNEALCQKQGNPVMRNRPSMPAGESVVSGAADSWRVSATALDDQTCLVKAAGAISVVGPTIASGRGATPEELLLAGLASCTAVFLTRNAPYHGIPLERVLVRVRAELPDDPSEPIKRVEKIAELTGDFTDDEKVKLEAFAKYCAFGITLSKATRIEDKFLFIDQEEERERVGSLDAFERSVPVPDDPAYCSDGSCCVPAFASPAG